MKRKARMFRDNKRLIINIVIFMFGFLFLFQLKARAGENSCDIYYGKCVVLREKLNAYDTSCLSDISVVFLSMITKRALECGLFDEAKPLLAQMHKVVEDKTIWHFYMEAQIYHDDKLIEDQIHFLKEKYVEGDQTDKDIPRLIANMYVEYGDFAHAIQILLELLEEEPGFLRAINDISRYSLNIGDLEEAKLFADLYIQGDEDWYGTYKTFAMVYFLEDDMKNAWKYTKKYINRLSSDTFRYFLDGTLKIYGGDYEKAKVSFQKIFTDTVYTEGLHNRKWELAFAVFYLDLWKQRKDDIGDNSALQEAAETAFDNEEYDTAAKYWYLLSLKHPREPEYYYHLGDCFRNMGDAFHAVQSFYYYLRFYSPESNKKDEVEEYLKSRQLE